ncbi:MAG: ATP-binding cassette domain-containing protein [Candidatus Izemoplasma sp.]
MIEVQNLRKVFPTKERDFIALKGVSLKFEPGEFIAVLGESGSGKTTFLNMISGVDVKTSGKIFFNEEDADNFNDSKWREIRNQEIGFIFQRFNLIDHLTVMENIILPLILTGSDSMIAKEIALRLLVEVGLEGLDDKLANELSGGQRQRVAIARTIIINPTIILADEPTGALDSTTALEIMALLQKFAAGRIIIMVTHDEDLAYKNATRVVRLYDGEVIGDEIISEKNSMTRDSTNQLLTYETKVTRRLKKRLGKQFPEIKDSLVIGQKSFVPLERKYVSNNPRFTRIIAKKNFKQKIKINRRILLSFVISIALILVVNIVLKNIANYNFNLFDINNNYEQYLVKDYDSIDDVMTILDDDPLIGEVSTYYELYVQEMYLVTQNEFRPISSSVTTTNKGVFSPKMVSLPETRSNFYLNSQIIAGGYPLQDNHILVTSEFLLVRFYGYSLESVYNTEPLANINKLNDFIGTSLYMCGETIITGDDDIVVDDITESCYSYVISGVLNSYYNGINYSGNIFVPIAGYDAYLDDLEVNKGFTRVDEYYDEYVAFYLLDFEKGISITDLSTELDATVFNEELRDYNETNTLRDMLDYIYISVFLSLIVISGTIDINIVISSVVSRTREIGIYSCIGVSKKSIRNMFIFETMQIASRILFINGILFIGIALGFKLVYKNVVVDLTGFESLFGTNEMFSYEIFFSLTTIILAIVFLFISVLIPSFKAANMRAIDALRSE